MAEKLNLKSYADILLRAQQKMLLTVCKGHRTICRETLLVLAVIPHIDLKAIEREHIFYARRRGNRIMQDYKKETIMKWQERWNNAEMGKKTHVLLPSIEQRLKQKVEIDHYVTQFLTGHGNFNSYLKRFGFRDSALCEVCKTDDTPEHAMYDCVEIAESRAQFRNKLDDISVRYDLRVILMHDGAVEL